MSFHVKMNDTNMRNDYVYPKVALRFTVTYLHKDKETLLPALPNILPKSPQIPVKITRGDKTQSTGHNRTVIGARSGEEKLKANSFSKCQIGYIKEI